MLTVLGHARVQIVVEACSSDSGLRTVTHRAHEEAVALQQALLCIPSPESEYSMRNVASRLGGQLADQVSVTCGYTQAILYHVTDSCPCYFDK